MGSYHEPDWAEKPCDDVWKLIEIKGGVEVAKYPLSERSTTVLGRAVEQVHIPLHHLSISRQHARIAFDSQGIPWLKDLQSAHGVTVNKRKLPMAAIGKSESNAHHKGAQGVMLFPGDMLQFGASTRFYLIEGPAHFERGAMQAKLEQQKLERLNNASTEAPTIEQTTDTPQSSFDRSFDDEANRDATTDSNSSRHGSTKTLPMDMEVPEKHRKMFERLNAMKYKLGNLETEDERIRRKGELTDGQEKQLQRNAGAEEKLRNSIADLEETLYDKLYPDNKMNHEPRDSSSESQWEEDDDFFDRTKDRHEQSPIGTEEAESEKSLVTKWKKLFDENETRRKTSLLQAERRMSTLKEELDSLVASGSDDAFFVQNDLQLAEEAKMKVLTAMRDGDVSMGEIEKLLRIVNSKIQWDRETGYIGEGAPPPKTSAKDPTFIMPPPPRPSPSPPLPPSQNQIKKSPEADTKIIMPPPPLPPSGKSMTNEFVMPAPKRKRVVGPSMAPPSTSSSSTFETPSSLPQKPVGTLSFLNSLTSKDPTTTKQGGNNGTKVATSTIGNSTHSAKEDVWQAPKDQDGSGSTKLNAKFAGRY